MVWKENLKQLEKTKQWDKAIELMQNVINENPDNMDAYLSINYLLMNLLVEENYDRENKVRYDRYETLIKWYFNESYAKFSNNPEYLYITARTAVMSEWYFGIDVKDYEEMLKKAMQMDPSNLMYIETYYWDLYDKDPVNKELVEYAYKILRKNSPLEKKLKVKGSVGEYIWSLKKSWAKEVLEKQKT